MKKKYKFNYDLYSAEAHFVIDTEVFTEEEAKETLEFFTWDYDKDKNPIDEVLKKYALEAIKEATSCNLGIEDVVIKAFNDKEGFSKIDGSAGIELTYIEGYEIDESRLEVEIE